MTWSARDLYDHPASEDEWCHKCGGSGKVDARKVCTGPATVYNDDGSVPCPRCGGTGEAR